MKSYEVEQRQIALGGAEIGSKLAYFFIIWDVCVFLREWFCDRKKGNMNLIKIRETPHEKTANEMKKESSRTTPLRATVIMFAHEYEEKKKVDIQSRCVFKNGMKETSKQINERTNERISVKFTMCTI